MNDRPMTDDEILAAIAEVRQDTIEIYKQIAALTDAAAVGWKVREPGQVDVTMELIRKVLREKPTEARRFLAMVADNDSAVVGLTRVLAGGR